MSYLKATFATCCTALLGCCVGTVALWLWVRWRGGKWDMWRKR